MTMIKEMVEIFRRTPGAMAVSEAIAVFWCVTNQPSLPSYNVLDLGSHAGKSTLPLIYSSSFFPEKKNIYMVDPLYSSDPDIWTKTDLKNKENVPWIYGLQNDFVSKILKRLSKTVKNNSVDIKFRGALSEDFLISDEIREEICDFGIVYIDSSSHEFHLITKELSLLEDHLKPGSLVFLHDYGNYTGPIEAGEWMKASGKYSALSIPWGEIRKMWEDVGGEGLNNSWHVPGVEFPNFLGAFVRR